MKKSFIIVIVLLFTFLSGFSQYKIKPNYYVIYLKDKIGNNYSIEKPQEFLSNKAIERRIKYNIPVTNQDLPVNKVYIDKLIDLGFEVKNVSKWLNCVIVYTTDTLLLKKITDLDFIRKKPYYQRTDYKQTKIRPSKITPSVFVQSIDGYEYGLANYQTDMLFLSNVHSFGYDGKGITIAILDAGFFKVNKLPAFDSIWKNKQILSWYDFVEEDTSVFDVGTHGMKVLSTIGGNTKNLVGTAPKANFYLFRTEDENSEYPIEEFNYICACEKADSLGVDLIHSSLGYNDFDDKSMNYSYKDMNGSTAISTIGADIAASKGIMVITSAGNEGYNSWKYITAPGDADSVLTVGAVNFKGKYVSFSSIGPTNDGRIKPNVTAMGLSSAVQGVKGTISYASGTSFSAPIVAGAVACLMQAFPEATNMELIEAIERCSSQAKKPDEKMGYGIPDFYKAYLFLDKKSK